jgi:hypothetical protein
MLKTKNKIIVCVHTIITTSPLALTYPGSCLFRFAYHHDVMDGIGLLLEREGVEYVRIDGMTPPYARPRRLLAASV